MKSDTSSAGRQSESRPQTQTRRTDKKTEQRPTSAKRKGHTFPTSIQVVIDESTTLSTIVQEWLASCVDAFMQAVKHQLALLTAPPERKLLPPAAPDEHKDDPVR